MTIDKQLDELFGDAPAATFQGPNKVNWDAIHAKLVNQTLGQATMEAWNKVKIHTPAGFTGIHEGFFTTAVTDPTKTMAKPTIKLDTAVPLASPQPKVKKDYTKLTVSDLYKYESLNKYVGFTGDTDVRAGTTFVGVEIELEKVVFRTDIAGTWKAIEDNSLKDAGKEFVTIPLQFQYLEVELMRLKEGLKSFNSSKRCSVHVHINVRDFTLEELKSFIILYMIFEKSLYNYSGNRWNNNFCVPLSFNTDIVRDFLSTLEVGAIKEKWYKYFGFNLSPIFGGESSKIGTIEFRHMVGTLDIPYILNWINLIVSLKISAKKMPYADLEAMVMGMNTDSSYYLLAEKTFREYKGLVLDQPTFKDDVEFCVSMAKQTILPNKTATYQEEIKMTMGKGK